VIRRAGSTYKHVQQGIVLGTHRRKADAKLVDDALRLGMTPEKLRKGKK
jgi:hypothetical protein